MEREGGIERESVGEDPSSVADDVITGEETPSVASDQLFPACCVFSSLWFFSVMLPASAKNTTVQGGATSPQHSNTCTINRFLTLQHQ